MTIPSWANPRPTINLSDLAGDFGCFGAYGIVANITAVVVGSVINFSVTSPGLTENLNYLIETYTEVPTPTPTPGPTLPPSPISISPATSTGSITLAGGSQTTTGSFTITNPSNSGISLASITMQEASRPTQGSTSLSITSFNLTPGQSQVVAFTCTSPPLHNGIPYVYTFAAIIAGSTNANPTHTHTQNF